MITLFAIVIICFVGVIIISRIERKQKRRIIERNNPKSQHQQQSKYGVTRLSFDELQQYVKSHGGTLAEIPESVMINMTDEGYFELFEKDFIEINKNIDNRKKWETTYQIISEHRVTGMTYENNDDSENAINEYATAIKIGESCNFDMFHAYQHAYERIIALLRRTPDVVTLEQYCRAYITHPVDESTRIRINNIIQSI